jgi:hypothetical protein
MPRHFQLSSICLFLSAVKLFFGFSLRLNFASLWSLWSLWSRVVSWSVVRWPRGLRLGDPSFA